MPSQKSQTNKLVVVLLSLLIICLCSAIWTHVALTKNIKELLAIMPTEQSPGQNQGPQMLKTDYELQVAAEDAARFINAHLQAVDSFSNYLELLDFAIQQVGPDHDGLFCEFGVFSGSTVNFIASRTKAQVHGFDSFEGLPEKWREGYDEGKFSMDGLPEVRENVKLYKGWFDETVPAFIKKFPGKVSFLHMDADLYSSTKTVFDLMGDQIVEGTIIVFDEFLYYPGWQLGEFKAFHELVEERNLTFEYIGRVVKNEQVAVKITGVGSR